MVGTTTKGRQGRPDFRPGRRDRSDASARAPGNERAHEQEHVVVLVDRHEHQRSVTLEISVNASHCLSNAPGERKIAGIRAALVATAVAT